QGFKVLSVSPPGHYPPGGQWRHPVVGRQPLYLYDRKIPLAETLDRNLKCTFFVTVEGAGRLIDQTLGKRKVLAVGQGAAGGIAASVQAFARKARIVGLPGLGSGGPDGWKKVWSDRIHPYDHGTPIDLMVYRDLDFF